MSSAIRKTMFGCRVGPVASAKDATSKTKRLAWSCEKVVIAIVLGFQRNESKQEGRFELTQKSRVARCERNGLWVTLKTVPTRRLDARFRKHDGGAGSNKL